METMSVGKSSGEAVTGPDPSWRGLYRAGGVSAVLFVVLTFAVPIVLGFITPLPPSAGGAATLASGVTTLQYIASHRSVFILNQVLFFGPGILAIVAFLALYMALKHLNKSYAAIGAVVAITSQVLYLFTFSIVFGLVYLSDLYVAATTAAQRTALATTADGLIAQYNTVSAAGILFNIGILIISLVMLKGVFHKGVAYLGIVTGVLGIISEALRPILGVGYAVYGVLFLIWLIAVGWKLYRLGSSSSHSRIAKKLEARALP
jgi:hypothetical protein